MKKSLLVLGILFFSINNNITAQQYKINVSGYYGSGSSGCGTINGLRRITLIYKNGTREKIHDINYYRNKNFNYSRNFTQTNPVIKVEFFSTTRHKTWVGDCRSGRDATKTINVSIPCHNQRYSKEQLYQGRTDRGSAFIEIQPLPQIKFTNGSSINSTQTVCETSAVKLTSEYKLYSAPSTVYKWEFLDPVNKITVQTAGYKVLLSRLETARQRWEDCVTWGGQTPRAEEKKKKEDKLQGRPPGGGGDCSYYMEQVMDLRRQVNAYNPKTEQVSIWRPITNKNGQTAIDLYLSDLYTSGADRKKALNNLKIQVRLNPSCNGTNDKSRSLSVQFLPEPPKIAKPPTFNQPLCSYSDVNGFILYFDRQLYSHEKIEVNLLRKFLNGSYVPEDNNINITSLTKISTNLYKYTWRSSVGKSIKGGDYRIEVSGFNKANNSPFCLQYKYDFKITVPSPIVFDAVKVQDELCYNSKDGKIKITASGGTGSYQYSLNNGVTWSSTFVGEITLSNKVALNYSIKVKDSNGCIDQTKTNVPITIVAKSKISHVITTSEIKQPSASGQSDGSIKINSITGGTPIIDYYNYTILLKGSTSNTVSGKAYANGFIIANLPAGVHTIIYTDKNNCTQEYLLPNLTDPQPITFTELSTQPDCNGGNDGEIKISNIKGGYPPYKVVITQIGGTYNKTISNIGVNTTVSENVSAGNYKITVKDSRLIAVFEKPITVNNRSKIEITKVEASPILCNGNNSTIKITAVGGKTGSYQYAIYKPSGMVWQNSNTFLLPANSNVGYSFQVRDSVVTNCKSSISTRKKISEPSLLEIISSSTIIEHNNIFGESKGKISLTIDGGTLNYNINWSKRGDGAFSKQGNPIIGLSAGFYTATVLDKNGCSITSNEIEVKENAKLITSLSITKEINCNGGLGSLLANTQGGDRNYTYEWFKEGTLISGQTTNTLSNVVFGNYSVKVYDSYTNTSASKELINAPKLELQVTKTNITCFGKEDGSIKITASGGSGGYLYSIDNKTSYQPVSSLTNSTITGLIKGTYDVWLKDKKGCEISTAINVVIEEPIEIKIDTFTIVNCDVTGGDQGEISIDVSGGEGSLSYTWSKNGSATFLETTKKITGLYAGIYNVLIKDNSNCELTKSFEIKEPLPIQVVIQETNNISCFNGDNGALLALVSGGFPINSTSADFEYKWYVIESGIEKPLNTDITLNSISGLVTGKYKVVVNDARGATISAEVILTQPNEIEISLLAKQDVSCFEGADAGIDISVKGGIPGYTYLWAKEGDVSFSKTTKDIDNLKAGKYKVEVKDINECKVTSVVFEIKQPEKALNIETFNIVNLTGFETSDGSISVTMTGGTPNYIYEWREEGVENVIGIDSKIENLKIGKYEVTIKDSKGCEVIETYTLTQPELLEITSISQSTDILCFGDKGVNLNSVVSGGVKPYTYSWVLKGSVTELSNTSVLNNVGAGNYLLHITDANLIKVSKEYSLIEPLLLEPASIKTEDVSCYGGNNGSIEVTAKGGTAPYVYNWNHGETGNVLTNLSSGKYTVTIRDKNLCETTKEIVISEPLSGLSVKNEIKIDVTGNGLSNGSIEVEIEGGTAPYTYQWQNVNGTVLSSSTNVLSEKKAGDYTLIVTDAKMCQLTLNYTINEPLPLLIVINEIAVLCNGEKGELIPVITGGVEPYAYTWYNSEGIVIGTDSKLNYVSGIYSLEVLDAKNNSKRIDNINITEPLLLDIASIGIENVICYQGNGGAITVNVVGGVKPYNYKWNHSSIDSNEVTTLKAGLYTVTVTDKNGCSVSKENIEVLEPDVYDIKETKLVRPSNSSVNNGSIYVKIIGGLAPYNYVWKDKNDLEISNKITSEKFDKIENLKEGTYKIIITDSKGCITEETYNLADPGELLVSITQIQEISCFGGSNGIIDVIPVGGVGGNNYTWYNAVTRIIAGTSKQLENIPAGKYYVVVNNVEGIEEQSAVFTVKEPTQLKITGSIKDLSCFESNDGEVNLNTTGGSGVYEYRYRLQGNSFSDWVEVKNNLIEIKGLQVGVYGVQLRDSNNCYATNTNGADEYLYTINQPNLFNILTEVIEEPTGFGLSNGSIAVSVDEGRSPYNYRWKKGLNIISNVTTTSATNTISSLNSGEYTVIVTSSKGCKTEKTFVLEEPLKLEATIDLIAVINCKGEENGALQANVKGGILDYTYKWFKEGSTAILGTEKSLLNLGKAIYYLEVEDSKGNKARSSSYELIEPETLTLELSSDYILCGIGTDWTITSIVSGGTAPYSYLWNTGSNSANLENVEIGSYELTVVDANGCRSTINTTLNTPSPLNIDSFKIINPVCYEGNDGKIELNIVGGASPYNIQCNNQPTGSTIENLTAGIYEVLITDIKGCTYTSNFEIKNPEKIEFDLGETVTLCKGQTYVIDASIEDGVEYTWSSDNSFSSSSSAIEVSEAGIYNVVIKTKLGCIISDSIEVKQSTAEINSEFTMSSQVYTNESFVIVNLSDPRPDEVVWFFPSKAKIIEKNDNYAEIIIEEEGEYEITILSRIGDCEELLTKKVLVLEKEIEDDSNEQDINRTILSSVVLYPNPSSGKFNLDIELNKENPINLKFYRLNSTIIKQEEYKGKNIYKLAYDFNLVSGVYFVLIETKKERILKKIIIN